MRNGRTRIRLLEYLNRHDNYNDIIVDIFDNVVTPSSDDLVIDFSGVEHVEHDKAAFLTRVFQGMRYRGRSVYIKGLSSEQLDFLETRMRLARHGDDDGFSYVPARRPKPYLPDLQEAAVEPEDEDKS